MAKDKNKDKDTPVAPDPEIARVADALALPEGEDDAVVAEPEPEAEAPKVPVRKKKAVNHTHVVTDWCGTLLFHGKRYDAGDSLALTEAEAESIGGKNVEPIS